MYSKNKHFLKIISDTCTAIALTHDSETDERSSDSDENSLKPSHNVVMRLPPSHAVSAERSPTVGK